MARVRLGIAAPQPPAAWPRLPNSSTARVGPNSRRSGPRRAKRRGVVSCHAVAARRRGKTVSPSNYREKRASAFAKKDPSTNSGGGRSLGRGELEPRRIPFAEDRPLRRGRFLMGLGAAERAAARPCWRKYRSQLTSALPKNAPEVVDGWPLGLRRPGREVWGGRKIGSVGRGRRLRRRVSQKSRPTRTPPSSLECA